MRFNFATPEPRTEHRVVEIAWLPRSDAEWAVYTSARLETARLWNTMVGMHALLRRYQWKWPTLKQWQQWAKGRFPAISAQSAQQTIANFVDTLSATAKARKAGEDARYPWRSTRYRDVTYTNQDATIRNGILRLSHGRCGKALSITLPVDRPLPGRLMEVTLGYGIVRLVCEVPAKPAREDAPIIGVDLGVNTIAAATDGTTAVLVSGREAKSIVQYRNKAQAELTSRIARAKRGSKRRKRLARAKYRMLEKQARRLKDVLHKSTRVVANAFPNAKVVVGKPFNGAAERIGRKQAQQVSSASNRVLIAMLAYKLQGAEEVPEPYSSQTCPGCGCRQKCRRVYKCKECGLTAPRDVIGCTNIRRIKIPDGTVPTVLRFVRPLRKYPASKDAGSSRGTLAPVMDGCSS